MYRFLLLQKSKCLKQPFLTFTFNLIHSLPSTESQISMTQPNKEAVMFQVSTCTNLQTLNQIYARIIRTHMLLFNPTQFYYNHLLGSYTRIGSPTISLRIFSLMSRTNVLPDCYTLTIVIKAVCLTFAVNLGREVHCLATKLGLDSKEYCESGLISFYCKLGDFMSARKVFDDNPERKLGSWNAIISGLGHGGHNREAVDMYMKMRKCGFEPDDVTVVSVVSVCGALGDLNLALQLHKYVFCTKRVSKSNVLMMNSVVDMYAKCGRMDLATKVFWIMKQKNVSSWTSMIVGHAMHGNAKEALEYFELMQEAGVRPNRVTFVGVLSACRHGGKVQEGRKYLNMMRDVYNIEPELKHYGCMVDMLGRVGLIEEAKEMVESMPMKANVVIWGSMMGACEKHENVEMAKWVAKNFLELEPWNDGVYVVLSNIYASRGLWEEVEKVRLLVNQQKLMKFPAYSLGTTAN